MRISVIATLLGAAALCTVLMAGAVAAAEPPQSTPDGLELVKHGRMDLVYRRPGADLTPYRRILLDPVQVEFKKEWTRDFRNVSSSERERIRRSLSEETHKVFVRELQEKGGYAIVDAPAPDVLRVTPAIVELYINAPDVMSTGRSRTYAVSAGEMMLLAELRDSESGAVLARVADRERARESAFLQWSTRATNAAEARQILGKWAGVLREALDAAWGKSR